MDSITIVRGAIARTRMFYVSTRKGCKVLQGCASERGTPFLQVFNIDIGYLWKWFAIAYIHNSKTNKNNSDLWHWSSTIAIVLTVKTRDNLMEYAQLKTIAKCYVLCASKGRSTQDNICSKAPNGTKYSTYKRVIVEKQHSTMPAVCRVFLNWLCKLIALIIFSYV